MTRQDQIAVAQKLLDALRPAAPRPQSPLDESVPLSAVIAVVRSALAKSLFFPPESRPEALGDGAVIERRGKLFLRVHERYEIGQLRYSKLSSRYYVCLRSAVLRYLRHYDARLRLKRVRLEKWS